MTSLQAEEVPIVLDIYKLADSDNENVRDLNANEHRKDGLKSKSIEKVCLQKVEGKHGHLLMVCSKLIESAGNFTRCCPRCLTT